VTDVPAHLPDLPKERLPVGCVLFGLSVAVLLWGFELQLAFWAFVGLVACATFLVLAESLRARRRGWTVVGSGPQVIRYGQKVGERWEWIEFWMPGDGAELFVGAEGDWAGMPDWARRERGVVLERLTRKFPRLTLVERDWE